MNRRTWIATGLIALAGLGVVGGTAAVAAALEPRTTTDRAFPGGPLTDDRDDEGATTATPAPSGEPAPPADPPPADPAPVEPEPVQPEPVQPEPVQPPAPQPVQPYDDDDDDGDDDDGGDDDGDD